MSFTEGVPQRLVLGPQFFTMYTAPLGDIIEAHEINYINEKFGYKIWIHTHFISRSTSAPSTFC